MAISGIDTTAYALRLRRPTTAGGSLLRCGWLIELRDDRGHAGFGECAPLRGLHSESHQQAGDELARAAVRLRGAPVGNLETLSAAAGLTHPSARFALEMAWVHLQARRTRVSAASVLGARTATVPVNGLLAAEPGEIRSALDRGALAAGATIKLKVGRIDPRTERRALRLLLDELAGVRLRLDGNGQLELDRAEALLAGLDAERIEYFEEPLRDPSENSILHHRTGVGIALDESLRDSDAERLWHAPGVSAWVLKPGLLGGIVATRQMVERAGVPCVISSCFESGLSLWLLAALAASLADEPPAAGLATAAWLQEDLIDPPFSAAAGTVSLADAVEEPCPARLAEAAVEAGDST